MGFDPNNSIVIFCINLYTGTHEQLILFYLYKEPSKKQSSNIHCVSEKNVCYLIFCNLKPEPVFIIFGIQYPDNSGQRHIFTRHCYVCKHAVE